MCQSLCLSVFLKKGKKNQHWLRNFVEHGLDDPGRKKKGEVMSTSRVSNVRGSLGNLETLEKEEIIKTYSMKDVWVYLGNSC